MEWMQVKSEGCKRNIHNRISIFRVCIILIAILAFSGYSIASSSEIIFSFGLVADIHYAERPDEPDRPRYYQTTLDNLREAVEIFNTNDLDFVVSLGDSITESRNKETTLTWLRRMDAELSKFEGDIHYVIGNHDIVDITRNEFIENTSGAVKQANYFFDKDGYRFIVIDANWEPRWTVHDAVVMWLEEILYEAKDKGYQAVVFVHQPLDNRVLPVHGVKNADQVRTIFEEVGNVFAVFQGHIHAGGYWYVNDVHYMGIQAMVNFPFPVFAIVHVLEDGSFEVDGYFDGEPLWSFPLL